MINSDVLNLIWSLVCFSKLDAAAMCAIASLLSGLPLQPEDVEEDLVEAKSKLFLK